MKKKLNSRELTDRDECIVDFIHVNGDSATFTVSMNPLTGSWLMAWKVGEKRQYEYDTKTEAVKMINSIIKKSAEKNLPCDWRIQPRTVMPDVPKQTN